MNLNILTVTQMVISIIASRNTASTTVLESKKVIKNYSKLGIIWVPSHNRVIENEKLNNLPNRARVLPTISLDNPMPFNSLNTKLRRWAETSRLLLCNNAKIGRITKILRGDSNKETTMSILKRIKGNNRSRRGPVGRVLAC